MEHYFSKVIKAILAEEYGIDDAEYVYQNSLLIQYLNFKTKSADRGSKSRSSFANLYALYVLLEDYLKGSFDTQARYKDYEGASYVNLFNRQRELPFGNKLQNHALNNRLNAEFEKYFPLVQIVPIIRDLAKSKYWINENLLTLKVNQQQINIAKVIVRIIDAYISHKTNAIEEFIEKCETLKNEPTNQSVDFIRSLLDPQVDARLFEIVSFAILKYHYRTEHIYWGYSLEDINQESLKLFKTGRTNANDGGIDFVMRPLGRFFQVTESLDFKKFFLDIDKIQRYPLTFVIESNEDLDTIRSQIEQNARKTFAIESVIRDYMNCIEELINIPTLMDYLDEIIKSGGMNEVMDEIILQSKTEFNR